MSRMSRREKVRKAKEEKVTIEKRRKGAALDPAQLNSVTGDDKVEQINKILHESFLKPWLADDQNITDINYDGVKIQLLDNKVGTIRPKKQPTQEEVRRLINQIANIQGSQLNNSAPIMDTEIGYLRVNAVDDSASPDGITFSIRVSRPRLAIGDISEMTVGRKQEVSDLLDVLIKARSNIIISGETGTGKTELQKLLVGYIDDDDLIVLIEDTRDSHIKALYPNKSIKSWQTLTSDDRDRKYEISDFIKAGLRNFPKWMLVSETRGSEAADMLDSAKTSHSIITTLHSTGTIDTPSRLLSMVRQSPAYTQATDVILGREITKFLRFGIHLERDVEQTDEGSRVVRRIKEIMEYTGYDESGPTGTYLYRAVSKYDEKTGEYKIVEEFGTLSETTIAELQDKRVYHMLPDIYKPNGHNSKSDVIESADNAEQVEQRESEQSANQDVQAVVEDAKPDNDAKILALKKRIPKSEQRQRPAIVRNTKQEPTILDVINKEKEALRAQRTARQS